MLYVVMCHGAYFLCIDVSVVHTYTMMFCGQNGLFGHKPVVAGPSLPPLLHRTRLKRNRFERRIQEMRSAGAVVSSYFVVRCVVGMVACCMVYSIILLCPYLINKRGGSGRCTQHRKQAAWGAGAKQNKTRQDN